MLWKVFDNWKEISFGQGYHLRQSYTNFINKFTNSVYEIVQHKLCMREHTFQYHILVGLPCEDYHKPEAAN